MFLQVECLQKSVQPESELDSWISFDKFLLKNTIFSATNYLLLNCVGLLLSRQQLLFLLNQLLIQTAHDSTLHQECISIVKASIKQPDLFAKMFQRNSEILPLDAVQVQTPIDNIIENIIQQIETTVNLKRKEEKQDSNLELFEQILKTIRKSKDALLRMWNNHKAHPNFITDNFQFWIFQKKVEDLSLHFSRVAKINNEKTKINIQLRVIHPLETIHHIAMQECPLSISLFWTPLFGNTAIPFTPLSTTQDDNSFFKNTYYSKLKKKRTFYDYVKESGKYDEQARFRTELKIPEEFIVPEEKLELIGLSNALRYQLGEESLQTILLDIDTDTHKEVKLQHYLQTNSEFKSFADQVLYLFGEKELDEITSNQNK